MTLRQYVHTAPSVGCLLCVIRFTNTWPNVLIIPLLICDCHHFLPVSCEVPTPPQNGSIEPYQSTLVGAEIFFMCAPGFVPTGRMRANSTSDGITVDGTWTPDPAALVCNGEIIEMQTSD